MFSKNEFLDAIDELEMSPATYQNAEKLATFYSLYDHLYGDKSKMSAVESSREVIIQNHGDSEFLQALGAVHSDLEELLEEFDRGGRE
jgi:hypothetical protein